MNKEINIKYIENKEIQYTEKNHNNIDYLNKNNLTKIYELHESIPNYSKTPLFELNKLAERLKVEKIWVKDESYRFGLNAFKVLGGIFAVASYLEEKYGEDIVSDLTFNELKCKEVKEKVGDITFVTATDGNHGRGIAWASNQLGYKSVIFMPKGSSKIRLNNIKKEGAEAYITDFNYDESVKIADKYARDHNGVLIQDNAWKGYEKIPKWIMQGYTTIIDEVVNDIEEKNEKITHVFLQAGVGSFASSILGYLVNKYGSKRPKSIIVEPEKASCMYKSAVYNDGIPHRVDGSLNTIMSGLACGEPSTIGWDILKKYADMFVSCSDNVSAKGMRILGNPLSEDPKVISGESGAVGLGLLSIIQEYPQYKEISEKLKIDSNSKILIINTEGDTDPQAYRDIVWDGKFNIK